MNEYNLWFSDDIFKGMPIINFGYDKTQWLIIAQERSRLLLLSKDYIRKMKFSSRFDGSWVNSDIRQWLNLEYYNKNFSSKDKELIIKTEVKTLNKRFGYSDEYTDDYIFLLSDEELKRYLPTDEHRRMEVVAVPECYWLRNRGCFVGREMSVDSNKGCISMVDNCLEHLVRPAMWVDLTAIKDIEIARFIGLLNQRINIIK